MPASVGTEPVILTIDVEDWPQSTWDRTLPVTRRAADNTLRLLDLLSALEARSTMFVLGNFAESFPEVVREVKRRGHEVACHGYGHVELFRLSHAQFVDDLLRAKNCLEQITGDPVIGYRAPDFSIVRGTIWALTELAERGFQYDSSIFPIHAGRYGIPEWPTSPVSVTFDGGSSIVEFPIGTFRLWGRNWPLGGGGYHRLLPGSLARSLTRRAVRERPFVFYSHPYEFDSRELAEIPLHIPLKVRLHQGLGRGRFERRFETFVRAFGSQRLVDFHAKTSWPVYRISRDHTRQ